MCLSVVKFLLPSLSLKDDGAVLFTGPTVEMASATAKMKKAKSIIEATKIKNKVYYVKSVWF